MRTLLRIKSLIFLAVMLAIIGSGKQLHAQTIWDGTTVDMDWYTNNTSVDTFFIYTAAELAGFSQLVGSGNRFTGKYVNLMSDIWLNAENDSTNNWTPIGGNPTASGEDANSSYLFFEGVFNGNFFIIHNLYCDKSSYYQAGLFGAIRSSSTASPVRIKNTILKNGKVKARGMAGTLLGYTAGSYATYVENCQTMNGTVISTGNNNVGCLAGATWPNGGNNYANRSYFINCAATGYVKGPYTGGIAGNGSGATMTNCYFAGTLVPTETNYGGLTGYGNNFNMTNCYSNAATGGIPQSRAGTLKTDAEMLDPTFIDTLGNTIYKADCGLNGGFPVLIDILCGVPVLGETNICSGTNTTLTATSWTSYLWSTGETTATITTPNLTSTTTYTVTGTTGTNSMVDTVTVNVMSNITVTGTSSPAGNASFSFPGGATNTYTQSCSNQAAISVTVSADPGYYLTRVVVNGVTEATFDPMDMQTSYTFSISPAGSSVWDIVAYVDNKYYVTIKTYALDDNNDRVEIDGRALGLVTPWGTNGQHIITYNNDLTLYIHETDRYHLNDIEQDGGSLGILDSVELLGVAMHHTIDVIYTDECDILSLPYTIGFLGTAYPVCWYRLGGSPPSFNTSNSYQTANSISFTSSSNYAVAAAARLDPSFTVSDLMVQFAFKAANTSTVFEVGVMTDPADATTFERVADIRPLNTNWNEYTVVLSSYTGEGRYIAFRSPYGISGTHYLDDVLIDEIADCIAPFGLRVTDIGESSAIVRWDMVEGTTNFTVEYEVSGSENWTTVTPNENLAILTGLAPGIVYSVRITACDGDVLTQNFTTYCATSQVGTPDATTTSNYLPTMTNYRYSYTQQIYLAEELSNTARSITGLSVQYTHASAYTRKMIIFLAHTSRTTFPTVNDFLPDTILSRVYTGDVTFNNQGDNYWFDITFDTPFAYNGNDNLLVVFADTTGSYPGTSYFRVHPTSENRTVYYYVDGTIGTVIDRTNPNNTVTSTYNKGVTVNRNNIRFMPCLGISPCIRPFHLTATNITENEATISWLDDNGNAEFELQYKPSDSTTWESSNLTTTSETLYTLVPSTTYNVRIRTICDTEDTTGWVTINFTTEAEPVQCNTLTVPYMEYFNTYSANEYPVCWTRFTAGYNNYPYVTTSTNDFHNAAGALDFHNTVSTFNMAILPEVDPSLLVSDLQVSFWAKTRAVGNGSFLLGVMDDPEDYSTFEIVDTIRNATANTWEEHEISLESYTGSGRYIAFMWKNGNSSNTWIIDELLVDYVPNCIKPDLVTIDSATMSSIYLHWNQRGNASNWNIEYGPVGFLPGTGVGTEIANVTNPYEITSLESNTAYDIYVQADCGGTVGLSQWSNPARGATRQQPTTLPYFCDFETVELRKEWTLENGTQANKWHTGTAVNNGGSHGLYISNDNGVSHSYTISSATSYVHAYREFEITQADMYSFSFDWKAYGESSWDLLRAFLVPDSMPTVAGNAYGMNSNYNTVPTGWTDLGNGVLNQSTSWKSVYKEISIADPGIYKLVFFWKNDGGTGTQPPAAVDNVDIRLLTCPLVRNVIVTDIADDFATIEWDAQTTAMEWEIEYDTAGYDRGNSTNPSIIATQEEVTLTGLIPSTTYDAYIRPICAAGDTGLWTKISFTTTCLPIATLPYTESFDTYGVYGNPSYTYFFPDCWSRSRPSYSTNYPYINSTNHSAPGSLYFYAYSGSSTTGATPRFDVPIDGLEVTFMLRASATGYPFIIGAISNPYDATTFEPIDTVYVSTANTFEEFDVALNTYTGTSKFIAFQIHSGTFYLDDVVIDYIPTCVKPQQVSATAITTQDITIDWLYGDENEWEIEVGATGFAPGTGAALAVHNVTTAPPYTITGLTASTSYDIFVRAICAVDDTSRWSSRLRMATECDAITIPYFENFDSFTVGEGRPIPCWNLYTTGSGNTPYIGTSTSGEYISAPNVLDFHYTATSYNLAIMPPVEASVNVSDLEVSFWANHRPNNSGTFTLGVMDNPTQPSTFTEVTVMQTSQVATWEELTYSLASYTGTGKYIAFKWEGGSGTAYIVDDLTVDYSGVAPDPCETPTNLRVAGITSDEATVSWTAGGSETEWDVEYRKAGDTDYSTRRETTTTVRLDNLQAATLYDVRVKAVCGTDDESGYVTSTFTTLPESTHFTISATAGANGAINPAGDISVAAGANQDFQFTPNANYKVKTVKIDNVEIDTTQYTGNQYTFVNVQNNATIHVDFELKTGIAPHILENSITIFPNPTESMLNVKLEMPFETIEITNMLGQVIYATTINDLMFSINVSQFNAGVYFIKLSGKEGTTTKKFVKN